MARVTREDCAKIVPNKFELVLFASERTKQITSGAPVTIEYDNDKDTVVALREIAEDRISPESLEEAIIVGLQNPNKIDVIESDDDLLSEEVGDDFEYVSDGEGFLIDDDHSELEAEDAFDDISEEAMLKKD